MGHIGLDDHSALEIPDGRITLGLPAEIHRLEIAVFGQHTQPRQSLEVVHGLDRGDVQGEQGGIGSDHQFFLEAAFQAKDRHAEGLVLIGLLQVEVGKGRFGNAPRHTMAVAVLNLHRHRFPGRLVEERMVEGALEQQRHQVFKHGPGPAEQYPAPADGAVGPAHREPVLHGHIPPGDGEKTAEPGLAGQQVVIGAVQPVHRDVVADGEQLAFGLIEKAHVHARRQVMDIYDQLFGQRQGFTGQPLGGGKGGQDPVEPGLQQRMGRQGLLPDPPESRHRLYPPVGKVGERGGPGQVLTDGGEDRFPQRGQLRVAFLGQDLDPGEITLRDRQPGRSLLRQLSSPGNGPRGRHNGVEIDRHPALQAELVDDGCRGTVPVAQQGLEDRQAGVAGPRLDQGEFEDFTGVGQAGEGPAAENRLVQQLAQALFENPQGTQEIAAVDGGDVTWFERGQGADVIPVEQMPLVTLQAGNAGHAGTQPVDDLVDGQVAAVTGTEGAGQPQPDIGGTGAHRQAGLVGDLVVVGRQPAGVGADKGRKIAPGPAGHLAEQEAVLCRQRLYPPPLTWRQVQQPAEQRRHQPQNQPRCGLRQAGGDDAPEYQADRGTEECRQGQTGDEQRPPSGGTPVCRLGLPLQQKAPRDQAAVPDAANGIHGHRRLVRQQRGIGRRPQQIVQHLGQLEILEAAAAGGHGQGLGQGVNQELQTDHQTGDAADLG